MTMPESLVTVEWANTMWEAAGMQYQQANRDLHQYALLAAALLVRRHYPAATHLVVSPSEQGPYLTPEVIVDPECGLDDNEVEEYDDIQDELWSYLNALDDEDPGGYWLPFATLEGVGNPDPLSLRPDRRHFIDPTGRANCWALDLNLILFHYGDASALVN